MTKNIDLSALGLPPLPSQSSEAIGTLLWAREVLQQHLTITYAVKDPKGVEELKSIKIGGVDQWVHIRGRNRNNPILLFLHGGPGFSMIGLMDAIQRPWEDYFTVVQWDQRQTGKSYYSADDENNPLTIDQFIEDTEEVILYLRQYFNQEKLFLLGHSWGSAIGMHMAKNHPDWLHAYIGLGQVVNWIDGEGILYNRLLGHAKEQNESELVIMLEAIIPSLGAEFPVREKSFSENCDSVREALSRLAGEALMHHFSFDDALKMLSFDQLISPHRTLTDVTNSLVGDKAAIFRPPNRFTQEFMDIDLPTEIGSSFELPIFFFTGDHDWQTPKVLSDQWFEQIKAPHKELISFNESSHVVINEEPGKFLMALVNKVLPFAQGQIIKGESE